MAVNFDTAHLSGVQLQIAEIIKGVLGANAKDGSNDSFIDPTNWTEKFGHDSLLVLVHDGGDLARFVNWDYGRYDLCQLLVKALDAHGFYIEQCTSWYAAVYRCSS